MTAKKRSTESLQHPVTDARHLLIPSSHDIIEMTKATEQRTNKAGDEPEGEEMVRDVVTLLKLNTIIF